jgi:hypothetical protein
MNSPTIDDLGMLAALKSQTEQAEWYPDFVNMLGHVPTVQDYMMLARKDPSEYVTFPREKEDWTTTKPQPVEKKTLYDRVTAPVIESFRNVMGGYYKGKVPEELK